MNLHLIQAILFSLWAVLMLRLFRRAHRMHKAAVLKRQAAVHGTDDPKEPMAVKVRTMQL